MADELKPILEQRADHQPSPVRRYEVLVRLCLNIEVLRTEPSGLSGQLKTVDLVSREDQVPGGYIPGNEPRAVARKRHRRGADIRLTGLNGNHREGRTILGPDLRHRQRAEHGERCNTDA